MNRLKISLSDDRNFSVIIPTLDQRLFSAADVERRIKIRQKGASIAAIIKVLIKDYRTLNQNPNYAGSEEVRRSFVKDLFAVLGDAKALNSTQFPEILKLDPKWELSIAAGRALKTAIRKINTVRTVQFAHLCNNFANSLYTEAIAQ